ncbi:hypothetical protein BS47DRAFT_1359702 [Hydnum rufescens UP504]|uniref:Uncharacterized protein n=1 Tax=Hydnum rufescens UP504 TaxID=1448309 RepID=A0A9P6B4V9_9AGAM|nr:hypothetical protein BS47DRAFT_1359702 [Hydnum rufescens UP504]
MRPWESSGHANRTPIEAGHCLNQDPPPEPPRQQSHWLNNHLPNETPPSKKPPQPHTHCGRYGALGGVWFYIKFYLNCSQRSVALPNENLGMQLNHPFHPSPYMSTHTNDNPAHPVNTHQTKMQETHTPHPLRQNPPQPLLPETHKPPSEDPQSYQLKTCNPE